MDDLSQQSLAPMDVEALAALKREFAAKLDKSKSRIAALSSGDVDHESISELEELKKQFGDLEPGKLAAANIRRLMREPMIKREVDANRRLVGLLARYDRRSPTDRPALERELTRLINRYPGTKVGEKAKRILDEVKRQRD